MMHGACDWLRKPLQPREPLRDNDAAYISAIADEFA